MQTVPRYVSNLKRPVAGLFDVFSIDFAGPFPVPYVGGPKYLLVCVEHLTGWPVVRATKDATSKTVMDFVEKNIVHSFGPPKTVVIDNASCFTAVNLVDYMKASGIEWKTVAAYAPMSNGRAERMVGTIKKAVGRLVEGKSRKWANMYEKAVAGYRRRPLRTGKSPFELLYGV